MTLSALRTEARKGRLSVLRIAGKDWVTRQAIKDMMELCRVQPKKKPPSPADEHSQLEAEREAFMVRLATPNSRLAKDHGLPAQDALTMKLDRMKRGLKKGSR